MIRITPLMGGKNGGTGLCSLLEVAGYRILLDCGLSASASALSSISDESYESACSVGKDLNAIGGVDCVLVSHADMHHIGSLPLVCGSQGMASPLIICTLPVYKFGQIVLYDYFLNKQMEGNEYKEKYNLNDIDTAFLNTTTVKYNQLMKLPESSRQIKTTSKQSITVCALPSGRTIGGSIWRIRYGSADILYSVDINFRKELVLDGVSLDALPIGPVLMIVESPSKTFSSTAGSAVGSKRKKDDSNPSALLIQSVMETLRGGGNVIIPCETAGRILEFLQIFSKYWVENNIALYHLVFLSHMAYNTPEFARMQLEWMSDSLSKSFYNGKPNPFDLPPVRFVTNIRDLEKKYVGPKLVFVTDSNLSCGLSKELLLKWGGDPRCKVIFTENTSDEGSLAHEIRQQYMKPPIIATVCKPVKVELVGEELLEFRRELEKQKRIKEELQLRKRRQEELLQLNMGQQSLNEEDLEDDNDSVDEDNNNKVNDGGSKKVKKDKPFETISKFLEPNFVTFESKEQSWVVDEYGVSNDDLRFVDISSIEINRQSKDTKLLTEIVNTVLNTQVSSNQNMLENDSNIDEIPIKTVSTEVKIQFTCEFKEIICSGRADFKAMKTLTSKLHPSRLVVMRESEQDSNSLIGFAKSIGIESYSPKNRSSVSFRVQSEKLKMTIPQSLLPTTIKQLKMFSSGSSSLLADTNSSVSSIPGKVSLANQQVNHEGMKVIKYKGIDSVVIETEEKLEEDGKESEVINWSDNQALDIQENSIGVVSVGEVNLNSLRQLIEASGSMVEYRLGSSGGMLICGEQVIIRKENNNDFVIEGPPVPAFYHARKALYQQFAFI